MGRLEAFAMGNKPWASALDGVGNGLGYGLVLIIIAIIKEVGGSGSLTIPGMEKIVLFGEGSGYLHNGLMLLPPSSLILVAVYIWIQKTWKKELIDEH